jgi:hypothetical protein
MRVGAVPLSTLRPDSHSVRGELPPVSGESHPSKRATCTAVVRRSCGVPADPGAAFSRGRGPPPDSWTRLDLSAWQRLADPRELTLASPRRLTRHTLYRDGPAPILKAYRPSKAVQGSAPGGFSTRHPLIGNSVQLELPGLLPRPPHGLPCGGRFFRKHESRAG